ncbi:hypothetical protein ACWGH4_17800 [Streptomyces sp. NPDC054847]
MDSTNSTAAPGTSAPTVVCGASAAGVHQAREAVRAFTAGLHPPPDQAVTDTLALVVCELVTTHCATAEASTRCDSPPIPTH